MATFCATADADVTARRYTDVKNPYFVRFCDFTGWANGTRRLQVWQKIVPQPRLPVPLVQVSVPNSNSGTPNGATTPQCGKNVCHTWPCFGPLWHRTNRPAAISGRLRTDVSPVVAVAIYFATPDSQCGQTCRRHQGRVCFLTFLCVPMMVPP